MAAVFFVVADAGMAPASPGPGGPEQLFGAVLDGRPHAALRRPRLLGLAGRDGEVRGGRGLVRPRRGQEGEDRELRGASCTGAGHDGRGLLEASRGAVRGQIRPLGTDQLDDRLVRWISLGGLSSSVLGLPPKKSYVLCESDRPSGAMETGEVLLYFRSASARTSSEVRAERLARARGLHAEGRVLPGAGGAGPVLHHERGDADVRRERAARIAVVYEVGAVQLLR